jgi:deazaflavin-dependent oxidoreductase (nitroreductase family)
MTTTQQNSRPPEADGTKSGAAAALPATKPNHRPVVAFLTRRLNPLIAKLAGRRHVRAYALIEHRGRRSGRIYTTPVSARPIAGGFMVPMAFGEQADWFRNVQAAGECVIRWNGDAYHLVEPELMDSATAMAAFPRFQRMLAPLFARQYVRLRLAPSQTTGAV